jgi:hypothetical protein
MTGQGIAFQPSGAQFTRTTLKKVYDDALMNDGSLYIWDPRHALGAFNGIPTSATVIPNVARNQAAAILDVADPNDASLMGAFRWYHSANPATNTTRTNMERTAKLGLHIAKSHTVDAVNSYATFMLPAIVKSYIDTRVAAGDLIYISKWARRTRAQVAIGSGLEAATISWLASSSNMLISDNGGLISTYGTGHGGARLPAGYTTLAPYFVGGASSAWQSSIDTSRTPYIGLGAPDAYQSFNTNKYPAEIVYRIGVHNLTLAGMTYAAYQELDYAEYQAQCETEGGDFYEESGWTDPATLCP